MPLVLIEPALTGRRLRRAVTSPGGRVLVQAGIELTPDLLVQLQDAGVCDVEVEPLAGEPADGPTVEEELAALEARFAGHEGSPLMMELKGIVAAAIAAEERER